MVETIWGTHHMPIMLKLMQMLYDFLACPMYCDLRLLCMENGTDMQAFIHASAGEFNGLRLAWIGRALFLSNKPFDPVLDLFESSLTGEVVRTDIPQAMLWLFLYAQTVANTLRQ